MCDFLKLIFSGTIGAMIVFLLTKNTSDFKHFQNFIAILIALKNEFKFNVKQRGNEQSPFQFFWLEKILSTIEVHLYCEEITFELLEILEFCKDANLGNIEKRKHENGVPMVAGSVQEKIENILDKIKKKLPIIKTTSFFQLFLSFYSRKYFNHHFLIK